MSFKFKAGDKVRILHNNYPTVFKIGQTAEVVSADCVGVDLASTRFPGGLYFYNSEVEPVEAPKAKPTLATAVGLQPQTRKILNHLEKRGSISPMEALTAYGCFRLAAQVHNLRKAGFDVQTDLKEDEAGHRYARYRLAA